MGFGDAKDGATGPKATGACAGAKSPTSDRPPPSCTCPLTAQPRPAANPTRDKTSAPSSPTQCSSTPITAISGSNPNPPRSNSVSAPSTSKKPAYRARAFRSSIQRGYGYGLPSEARIWERGLTPCSPPFIIASILASRKFPLRRFVLLKCPGAGVLNTASRPWRSGRMKNAGTVF